MTEGLEGVVAAATRLSHVDGEAGRLTIAGYAVEDIAPTPRSRKWRTCFCTTGYPEPAELA